jgi:glycerol kinase
MSANELPKRRSSSHDAAMTQTYLLAIDQGTTGSTALLIDDKLHVVHKATREFRQRFPQPGWVEHEASAIWESVEASVHAVLSSVPGAEKRIAGIGITNQRETTCAFDAHSQALHPFIVWQDRRTADRCASLKQAGHEAMVRSRTGLVLDPYFSGTKMQWLLEHVGGLKEKMHAGDALFGTVDTWLVHKLTGGTAHVTDATNASRTLLMDLHSCQYSDDLLAMLDVPRRALPRIVGSSERVGVTKGVGFLPDGIPVAGIAGDQQAALFGQACFHAGEAKCTYGTGAFMLMHTGTRPVSSSAGLLTTVASKIGGEVCYALEGAAFIAGAAVQWLRDGLGIITQASEVESLARTVDDAGDVCFVPALAGLGAPHWQPSARGLLCGLTRDSHKGHIARAVLDGIAAQNVDVLTAMEKDAGTLRVLKVDGGAARNNVLMQIQADLLGVECVRPHNIESTALGAAALAGLAVGIFSSRDEVKQVWRKDQSFVPQLSSEARRTKIDRWHQAVARAALTS